MERSITHAEECSKFIQKGKTRKINFQMSWFLVCLELSDEFWIDLPAGREWLGNPMWLLLFCTTSHTVHRHTHSHVHTNVHAQIFVFLLCSYTIASSLLQEEALMMTWQLIGTQQTQYLYPSNAIHMCQNILRLIDVGDNTNIDVQIVPWHWRWNLRQDFVVCS